MTKQEEVGLTFSDEDFKRRYFGEKPSGGVSTSPPPAASPKPVAAQPGRSRNRFMRTLLRRRLAASVRS
jgi:hypothetical protein